MRTDVLDAYGQTLAYVHARVAGTEDEQYTHPTPCSEWDVLALLGHVTSVIHHYMALPGGQRYDPLPEPAPAQGRYRQIFPSLASAAVTAWSQPDALERTCHHVMGDMPGWQALSIHVSDVLLHGWDLSVATGQDDTIDPVLADLALTTLRDVLCLDQGRGRFFGAELTPAAGDVQSRLLAYAGRSWPPQRP